MTSELITAIQQNGEGTLSGAGLIRALISFSKWRLPATLEGDGPTPTLGSSDEGAWLQLFTETSCITAYEKHTGQNLEFTLEMQGLFVFSQLQADLAGVDINPHSEHAIHYKKHQLGTLRETAEGMILDEVLHGRVELPDAFERFKSFKNFRVPTREVDGRRQMMLAPDNQGRKLAAIFTTQDAADAFVADVKQSLEFEPDLRIFEGRALFDSLAQMPLDGIVFNCKGPGEPRAVAIQFAQVVLQN